MLLLTLFIFSGNLLAVNMQYLKYSPVAAFTNEDFLMLQETAVKALNSNQDGQVSMWKNIETGHKGSITPLNSSTIDGMQCRKTRISNASQSGIGESTFVFCKNKDQWKILK